MIFGKKDSGDTAELERQNKIMREALEFYSSQENWESGHKYTDSDDATIFTDGSESAATVDKGSRAFKTLKSCES